MAIFIFVGPRVLEAQVGPSAEALQAERIACSRKHVAPRDSVHKESALSSTKLSDFLALVKLEGENSVSFNRPSICVPEQIH